MRFSSCLFLVAALLPCLPLAAQNSADALRYSFFRPQGSSRFLGTGGAITPMGVDYTTMHTNPAGIGGNRFRAIEITLGLNLNDLDGDLISDTNSGPLNTSENSFNVPGGGIIWTGDTRSVNWPTFNFGFGITRLADFNENYAFSGEDFRSISDPITIDLIDFDDGVLNIQDIRFRAALFDDLLGELYTDDLGRFNPFDFEENQGILIPKSGTIEREGSINEAVFAFGGSYLDKLQWGVSLGIPFMSFEERRRYEEEDTFNELLEFDDATYTTNLTSSGTGVNFKFGVIYKPILPLRISAAVHSPTFWTIDETFQTSLSYNVTVEGVAEGGLATSPQAVYTYNLRTPWRFNAGVGYLIGNSGFVSLDADYANYAGNQISFDDFAEVDEVAEQSIDDDLGGAIGLRLGGEVNLQPLKIRAGVGAQQLPYNSFFEEGDFAEDEILLNYSLGAGYSIGKFYVDLAARYEPYTSFYEPYAAFLENNRQIVGTERTTISAFLTLGFRGF